MDSMFDNISRLIDFLPLAHHLSQQIPRIFILFLFFFTSIVLSFLHVLSSWLVNNSSGCDFGSHSIWLALWPTSRQYRHRLYNSYFICVCTDHKSACALYIQHGGSGPRTDEMRNTNPGGAHLYVIHVMIHLGRQEAWSVPALRVILHLITHTFLNRCRSS